MSKVILFVAAVAVAGMAADAGAQGRGNRNGRGASRVDVARAQGVPPGHLPPAGLCRVWYDNRPNGRQPSATSCRQAEIIAARDRNARVIYGEDVYDDVYRTGRYPTGRYPDDRYPDRYPNNRRSPGDWERDRDDEDRAVYRPGRNRAPRGASDPYYDSERSRYTTPAYQNGYRDGLNKGREDARDNDRYDPNRHSWYRSANRGYESEYGSRNAYQARYRDGFEAGYNEGYRVYARR